MLKLIDAEPGKQYDENKPIGKPSDHSRLPERFADTIPQMMVTADIPAIEITGGGEPTLWRGFDTLVQNLMDVSREIGLVTNGSQLNPERIKLLAKACKWIRFSFDSSNGIIHQQVHRTPIIDFERRIESLKALIAERNALGRMPSKDDEGLTIGISFIITPVNIEDVEDAAKLFQSLGVDHLRFSWMYDKTGTAGLTFDQIESTKQRLGTIKSEYETSTFKIIYEKGRIDTYSKPNTDFDYCYMQHFVWAIGADANVYPCCIMKYHPKFAMGNLNDKTLKELVESQNVLAQMHNLDVTNCFPCWLRTRNQHIENVIEKPMHANFV